MLLSRFEKALMNNPIRSGIQRGFEAERLAAMGGQLAGGHALEVGCGRGVGVEIIFERFGAERVDAFDLDPDMVRMARVRLAHYGDRVHLYTGDATDIEAEDASYDAAFDFGIIHHIPRWRLALAELYRVLQPGGRLFAEEVYAALIHNRAWRWLLDHPMEDRFDHAAFGRALRETGFELVADQTLLGWFGWFVAIKPP